MQHDHQYLDFMRHVQGRGIDKSDRTGTGTRSVFGYQMRFDLTQGFPLLTTKALHLKSIIHELIWFLAGDTNVKYLKENGVRIWDEWADENGDLGPVYGAQWRSWPGKVMDFAVGKDKFDPAAVNGTILRKENMGDHVVGTYQESIDQISNVINQIKNNPDSRRLIVSAWNPADIDQMKLPPCHALFQFYTRELTVEQRLEWAATNNVEIERFRFCGATEEQHIAEYHSVCDAQSVPRHYLDCQLYQRSADIFLGVPFNIASYALLTHMIAQQCNMIAGDFVWTGGDCHLYSNHMDQVNEQLCRFPDESPTLLINRKPDSIFDYKFEDFEFHNYNPMPNIKAKVAV